MNLTLHVLFYLAWFWNNAGSVCLKGYSQDACQDGLEHLVSPHLCFMDCWGIFWEVPGPIKPSPQKWVSCASAWHIWKGCWKDCARPSPDGLRSESRLDGLKPGLIARSGGERDTLGLGSRPGPEFPSPAAEPRLCPKIAETVGPPIHEAGRDRGLGAVYGGCPLAMPINGAITSLKSMLYMRREN